MPAELRDYWHRKLLGELGLKEGDRIRLIERTYTDKEIGGDKNRTIAADCKVLQEVVLRKASDRGKLGL